MKKKRDWLLQKIGIFNWQLKYHLIYQNKDKIVLPTYIRLLLISNHPLPSSNHSLLHGVLYSMKLTIEQFFILLPDQALLISKNIKYHSWWMGVSPNRVFHGIVLKTSSFSVVCNSAYAKEDLWKQISIYNL